MYELEKQTSSRSAHRDCDDVGNLFVAARRHGAGYSVSTVPHDRRSMGNFRAALCEAEVAVLLFMRLPAMRSMSNLTALWVVRVIRIAGSTKRRCASLQ